MIRQIYAAVISLMLGLSGSQAVVAQGQCDAGSLSSEAEAALDDQAKAIAHSLAGGEQPDTADKNDWTVSQEALPRRVLKWSGNLPITVTYSYWDSASRSGGPVSRNDRREQTVSALKSLVDQLRTTTGYNIKLVKGFTNGRDQTIDVLFFDNYIMRDWNVYVYDKYQYFDLNKRFNEAQCWVEPFYDETYRLKYVGLIVSFDKYQKSDISRCLAEGLMWAIGVPAWRQSEVTRLSTLDAITLSNILYEPRIEPGMTEAEALPVVREWLCEQQ